MKFSNAVGQVLAVGVLMALAGFADAQQAYPNKPIRFIVPFPPGGSTNIVSRLVGQRLSDSLGQQIVVDNRPGGNTIIGTEALIKSPPDGYTILFIVMTHVVIPNLLPAPPYDAIKDFAPVATLDSSEQMLVLHPSVPAKDLQEFITLAKTRPGQLNFASTGSGSSTHLAAEFFNSLAGVRMQHIPYKGAGPALTDLIGGQVQLTFNVPASLMPHIKSGKLKAIAISGGARLPALPQVPTFTEAGLPGFDVKSWQGVVAPTGTPKEIIDKLSTEIGKVLAMPDIREKLLSQGLEPFISTPAQLAALIKAETARYARIIKTASIRLE